MNTPELTLQLLSTIFALLGIIISIISIDRRWSLAAVIYRKMCSKDIDWEAERVKWQDAYGVDVDIESLPYEHQQDPEGRCSILPRTWSSQSDTTVVAGHGIKCDESTNISVQQLPIKTWIETPRRLGSRKATTSPDHGTHSGRKPQTYDEHPSKPRRRSYTRNVLRQPLIVFPSGRGGRRRLAIADRETVSVNETYRTSA